MLPLLLFQTELYYLYYKFDEAPGSEFELRGYGQTGAAVAADAWDRYIMLGEENE